MRAQAMAANSIEMLTESSAYLVRHC